jgi:hypothetical protein
MFHSSLKLVSSRASLLSLPKTNTPPTNLIFVMHLCSSRAAAFPSPAAHGNDANALNLSPFCCIDVYVVSLSLTQAAGFVNMGTWLTICLVWPSERISATRAGPRSLSLDNTGVEIRWSAACEGPVDEKVPTGRMGQRCDSRHAMIELGGVGVTTFLRASLVGAAVDINRL